MSEGQAVIAGQSFLLLAAWLWRGGTDRLIYWLGGAFIASLWISQHFAGIDRHAALAVLDAAVVAIATRAWISGDLRGWWIGFIGLAKVGLRLAVVGGQYGAEYHVSGWVFAAVVNLAFAAQVIIAGGITDELGKRIADYLRSAGPLRARLFRNVAGG